MIDTDAEGVVVYGEPNAHNHTQTNDFNLVRKIQENTDSHPYILLRNTKYDCYPYSSLVCIPMP